MKNKILISFEKTNAQEKTWILEFKKLYLSANKEKTYTFTYIKTQWKYKVSWISILDWITQILAETPLWIDHSKLQAFMFQCFSQIRSKIQSRWNGIVVSFGEWMKNLCEIGKDTPPGFQKLGANDKPMIEISSFKYTVVPVIEVIAST